MLLTLLALPANAAAHAYLDQATPPMESVVRAQPSIVRLAFTEPVEVNFSTFKVYPVPWEEPAETLPPEERNLRIRAAASQLVGEALGRRGDEAERADAGVATNQNISDVVVIRLKEDLPPGPYAVMWRVLSIDTHITSGFYFFTYEPADG